MVRLLPYESKMGPLLLHTQASTPLVASVSSKAVDYGALNRSQDFALHELQHVSSKVVSKMITRISEEIPLCMEEVEAISHQLNSRFNVLNPRIRYAKSIEDTNSSRCSTFTFSWKKGSIFADNERYRKKPGRLTSEAVFALETWLVDNFAEPCEILSWTCNHKCASKCAHSFWIFEFNKGVLTDPSAIEKAELARVTGLSKRQVWTQTRVVPVFFAWQGQLSVHILRLMRQRLTA